MDAAREYEPWAQPEHAVLLFAKEKVPAAQGVHCFGRLRPGALPYVPAGQPCMVVPP